MDMQLVSTRDGNEERVKYGYALLQGLAKDGGLYLPTFYPQVTRAELEKLKYKKYTKIAFEIEKKLIGGDIPDDDLEILIGRAYSLDKFNAPDGNITPVREIRKNLFVQNTSNGPTWAFKDMALQPLGQKMDYLLALNNLDLIVLGSTSGDTGSAAEAALKSLNRIKCFMLSPLNGMANFQWSQMGIYSGGNIFNISLRGTFDDGQKLVKLLKMDKEFSDLGAVNSINWGRISSQVPYYFAGYLQVASRIGDEVDFVVPTGNFGNVLAGYIAKRMGLPIRHLIIANNENNVMERLILDGIYDSRTKSQITSSPSMDIKTSSNYERLIYELLDRNPILTKQYMREFETTGTVNLRDYGISPEVFKKIGFKQGTSSHADRISTIRRVYNEAQTIIEPHTADGVTVAYQHQVNDGVPMIAMETALPVKFEHTIEEALGFIPEREGNAIGLEARVPDNAFYEMDVNPKMLKEYIRSNI